MSVTPPRPPGAGYAAAFHGAHARAAQEPPEESRCDDEDDRKGVVFHVYGQLPPALRDTRPVPAGDRPAPPSSLVTAFHAGRRGGWVVGRSVAVGYTAKALVQGGLGMLDGHSRKASLAVGTLVAGVSFVGVIPGVEVAVQGLQGLSGRTFSKEAVRTLQGLCLAGAVAAIAAPVLEALASQDEGVATRGAELLANNAAQAIAAVVIECMSGPVLGHGWMPTRRVDAQGQVLSPGTVAWRAQMTGTAAWRRWAALSLPAAAVHLAAAHGGNQAMVPLARLLGAPGPGALRFGQDSYWEHVASYWAVALMVAAVEAVRYWSCVMLQAGVHAYGWQTRTEPLPPADPPAAQDVPAQGLLDRAARAVGEDGRLRMFLYGSFLDLTVAALMTGPDSALVRWLSNDSDDVETRLRWSMGLSLLANLMIASADALAPMAAHHRSRAARIEEIADEEGFPAWPVGPVTRHAVHDEG